jgi:hypothetical protein
VIPLRTVLGLALSALGYGLAAAASLPSQRWMTVALWIIGAAAAAFGTWLAVDPLGWRE